MTLRISIDEKQKLFNHATRQLGAPIRKIQLDEEQMETLLEISVEDYVTEIHNFLIEHQWPALMGLDIGEADLAKAYVTQTLDYMEKWTWAYSKIVGLGHGWGGWILKKDYVELKKGKQIYEIPCCREINEVMWLTPATLDQSVIDPFLGVWNNQFGAEYLGLGSYYIMPAYDVLLRAQDRNLKNRIIRSELTYRVTNGPNGKKYLHLYSTPGGKFDYRSRGYAAGRVWYWYYDVYEDRDRCLEENKDIIMTPADSPVEDISYNDLNAPSRNWVRRYFVAKCKEALGRVRGTFGGRLPVPNAELTMDYESLLTEGKDEMQNLKAELKEQLDRFHPLRMKERMAQEAELLNKERYYMPFQKPYRII